jgi:3-oxoacyl-[acyl-carrier protein] reductase
MDLIEYRQSYLTELLLKGVYQMEKYALIVGASGEIGAAIAEKISKDGYHVILHYHKNKEAIEQLQTKIENDTKRECQIVQADLSLQNGVIDLVSQIDANINSIVYVSGQSTVGLVTDLTNEEIDQMTQLHIKSLIQLNNHYLPEMVRRKEGNIVVISSIWGQIGASCEVLYSTTKGAQNAYVMALAKEVAPSNIRVNAVAPGAIETKMLAYFSDEDRNALADDIPIGRLGTPNEVANTVSFLLSDHSSYITGQILGVNGGWHTS